MERERRKSLARVSGLPKGATHVEAVFELLADEVQDDGVYAGVHRGQIHAKMIHDQQEAENNSVHVIIFLCKLYYHTFGAFPRRKT